MNEPSTPFPYGDLDAESEILRDIIPAISDQELRDLMQYIHSQRDIAPVSLFSNRISLLLSGLLKPGDVRLRALALAFAAGCNWVTGYKTMREAARSEGVSVAWISKLCIEWTNLLRLPIGPNRKPEWTRDVYRRLATEQHKKRKDAKSGS